MGLFPETIRARLGGGVVKAAYLVEFDFTSQPMRLWRGNWPLVTNDGREWLGLGQLGSVSGVTQAVNGTAPQASFTLSGIDAEILQLARAEFAAEVRMRMARVYLQFFGVEDEADPGNERCLDNPYALAGFRMLRPTFETNRQTGARSVTITAEQIFALRTRPRHAMYTDRDQQARFAGDRGFEFVGGLTDKVVAWPS